MNNISQGLVRKYGYCPHCLCVKDARITVSVSYTGDDEKYYREIAENPTDPSWLLQWVDKYSLETNLDFQIASYYKAFIPVAIVNGTPLCPVHLWACTS